MHATATKIAQKNYRHLGIVVHSLKSVRNMVRSEKHDPELLTLRIKDPLENEKKWLNSHESKKFSEVEEIALLLESF